jgi:RNA polymerase-binding transcription factor DksA
VTREQLQKFTSIPQAIQAGTDPTLQQNRQKIGIETIAGVLEEVWQTADRKRFMANRGQRSGLLRNIRTALVRIKDEAFGACLCCRTAIGLRRLSVAPWTPLCIPCQEAADRNDVEVLRRRSGA